jgi:hypothetical protein
MVCGRSQQVYRPAPIMTIPSTDPFAIDTDRDDISDGMELLLRTDPQPVDSDRDGVTDGDEVRLGLNPTSSDTDRDGIPDGLDSNPLTPMSDHNDRSRLGQVADFALEMGTFAGARYAFTVDAGAGSVFIHSLDDKRPGLDGQGLLYAKTGDQIQSALDQRDLNNFAQVQQHLHQQQALATATQQSER